jgi:hypothetical protein
VTSKIPLGGFPLDGADSANPRNGFGGDGHTPAAADAAVSDAYWYASRLINVGWLIRRIGATKEGGFFVAETPRRRVVSVDEHAHPTTDPAAQFAKSISTLAAVGDAEGRDYLRDLERLLKNHAPLRRPATLTWRTWHIPGVPERLQPIPKIRAAYWFAVTLTDDYGWTLSNVGTPMAGGGFIADIPGETVAIYPASMPDDRTVASALARLLAGMTAAEVGIVAALVEWHNAARYRERRIR